jgi:nucleotide-binding universal stress UspA family protein
MTKLPLRILIPVDFTDASNMAVAQAALLNDVFEVKIELLHIETSDDLELQTAQLVTLENSLKTKGIEAHSRISKGSVLQTINETAAKENFQLMVVGTHGAKGIRQNLFGADILRLLKGNSCPSIILQNKTTPVYHFNKILLPVGSHEDYHLLSEAVALIAQASNAEVIIYSIERPMEEMSEQLLINKKNTEALFKDKGIAFSEVNEPSNVVSFGFAKQTLLFAEQNEIDLIAIMTNSSVEHRYFANAEKERILVNDPGIAILCAQGV